MRAAWWWIDRWRKSSAFTDMTAEEQGLYRNLLDETWLRHDHVIPDDARILAKVSGDPEAWQRCGVRVLQWMRKVEGGWTHDTALEIIHEARRRADKQQAYRERKRAAGNPDHNRAGNGAGNGAGNAPGHNAGNKPGSPSPSPSPSPEKKNIDAEVTSLAEYLRAAILQNTPDARMPQSLQEWGGVLRLMRDRDHRRPEDIRAVIDWATTDDFWRPNILSARKLREKFDTLKGQMARAGNGRGQAAGNAAAPRPNAVVEQLLQHAAQGGRA